MTSSVASTPKPLLVFDGDCGICTTSAEWLRRHLAQDARIEPFQMLDLDALGLTLHDVTHFAWWLADPDDAQARRNRGHRAIGRALLACRQPWPLLGRLILMPPFSWLGVPIYRLIARNRGRLPGATAACRLPPPSAAPPSSPLDTPSRDAS